jgi:hypothetical protein
MRLAGQTEIGNADGGIRKNDGLYLMRIGLEPTAAAVPALLRQK